MAGPARPGQLKDAGTLTLTPRPSTTPAHPRPQSDREQPAGALVRTQSPGRGAQARPLPAVRGSRAVRAEDRPEVSTCRGAATLTAWPGSHRPQPPGGGLPSRSPGLGLRARAPAHTASFQQSSPQTAPGEGTGPGVALRFPRPWEPCLGAVDGCHPASGRPMQPELRPAGWPGGRWPRPGPSSFSASAAGVWARASPGRAPGGSAGGHPCLVQSLLLPAALACGRVGPVTPSCGLSLCPPIPGTGPRD